MTERSDMLNSVVDDLIQEMRSLDCARPGAIEAGRIMAGLLARCVIELGVETGRNRAKWRRRYILPVEEVFSLISKENRFAFAHVGDIRAIHNLLDTAELPGFFKKLDLYKEQVLAEAQRAADESQGHDQTSYEPKPCRACREFWLELEHEYDEPSDCG